MNFFLPLNTEEDILKNVSNQSIDGLGLEQLEGEKMMTELSFLAELSL